MDAWETLVSNSTLDSGDAWEHLNNQAGGTGTGLVLIDGLGVNLSDIQYEVALNVDGYSIEISDLIEEVTVNVDEGFSVGIQTDEFEVEVDE